MSVSLESLMFCEGNWPTQLTLLAMWALLWYFAIPFLGKKVVMPFVDNKPWKAQWADLNERYFKTAFFLDFPNKDIAYLFACAFVGIVMQHVLGGLLCVPSVLGFTSRVATALACHGALCECGWELQDVFDRAHKILFGGELGRALNPPAVLPIIFMHHMMGLCMVLPMNVYYNDYAYYHELVFLLQGAAAVAFSSQSWGFTLDINTALGLKKMKMSVSLVCMVMLYSRVFRFWYIGIAIVQQLRADAAYKMMYMGGFVLLLMGIFNVLLVMDSLAKLVKFARMTHTDKDVKAAAVDAHRSFARTSSALFLSNSQKEWAKVRGAVHIGVFKTATVVANAYKEI